MLLCICFEIGYCFEYWCYNCVVVGFVGGFVELLEFIGIVLVELGVYLFIYVLLVDFDDLLCIVC